jgi:hypothetical protein
MNRTLRKSVAAEVIRLTIQAPLNALFAFALLNPIDAAERKRSGGIQDDFPFQAACISATFPGKNIAMKGIAVRLPGEAGMLFDTELLRVAAGWKGGFITAHGVAFDGAHGGHPKINGEQKFGTRQAPGWADANGSFLDPRKEPFGPLPTDWCRYDGLYVSLTLAKNHLARSPPIGAAMTAFTLSEWRSFSPIPFTALKFTSNPRQ